MVRFTKEQIALMDERGVSPKPIMRGSKLKDNLPDEESRLWVTRMVANSTGATVCEGEGPDEPLSIAAAFRALAALPAVNYNDPGRQLADKQKEIDRLNKQLAEVQGKVSSNVGMNETLGKRVDVHAEVRRGRPPAKVAIPEAVPADADEAGA